MLNLIRKDSWFLIALAITDWTASKFYNVFAFIYETTNMDTWHKYDTTLHGETLTFSKIRHMYSYVHMHKHTHGDIKFDMIQYEHGNMLTPRKIEYMCIYIHTYALKDIYTQT